MTRSSSGDNDVPVVIVREEDMALIEAAFSSAHTLLSSPPLLVSSATRNTTTNSVTHSTSTPPPPLDIEDAGRLQPSKSLFDRFRKRCTLSVTDLTASEWCEKQLEFALIHGKPERTEAMRVGSERHAQLEEEVSVGVLSYGTTLLMKNFLLRLEDVVTQFSSTSGLSSQRMEDLVTQFVDVCNVLPRSEEQLLLRYALQGDRSERGEFTFLHDAAWFSSQVQNSLDFWLGA